MTDKQLYDHIKWCLHKLDSEYLNTNTNKKTDHVFIILLCERNCDIV